MDIRTLQTALARIAVDRAGDPLQAPKNVALSLAADAGILLSLFRGLPEQQNLQDDLAREAAADALTSIVVSVAQLANHIGMDASAALRARIKGRPAPALAPLPQAAPPGTAAEPVGALATPGRAADSEPAPAAAVKAAPAPAAAKAAAPAPAAASAPAPAPATASVPAPVPEAATPAAEPAGVRRAADAPAPAAIAPASESRPAAKAPERKRGAPEVIAVKVAAAPQPVAAPPASGGVEVIVLEDETETAATVAAVAPGAEAAAPPGVGQGAPIAPAPDANERLDPERVLDLAKALAAQLGRSSRDDPVLRDLRDELDTLSRSLYASSTKKAWIAGSLRSLRSHLEDALAHAFAEEVRAAEFIGRIDALLAP